MGFPFPMGLAHNLGDGPCEIGAKQERLEDRELLVEQPSRFSSGAAKLSRARCKTLMDGFDRELREVRQHAPECLVVGELRAPNVEGSPQEDSRIGGDFDGDDADRLTRKQPPGPSRRVVAIK